jgi:hypothetical protein
MDGADSVDAVNAGVYDERSVSRSLEMILDNYRAVLENNGRYLGEPYLNDILYAYALYLYGDVTDRITMQRPEKANEKLNDALDRLGHGFWVQFFDWKAASMIVQALQMIPVRVEPVTMMRAFYRFCDAVFDEGSIKQDLSELLLFRERVNHQISELIESDRVLMPVYSAPVSVYLYPRRVTAVEKVLLGAEIMTVELLGQEWWQNLMVGTALHRDATREFDGDALLFLTRIPYFSEDKMVKWTMDTIKEGRNLILVTFPVFDWDSEKRTVEARNYLRGFDILSRCRLPAALYDSKIDIMITKIRKTAPKSRVTLVDYTKDVPKTVIINQSEFDWSMRKVLYGKIDDDFPKVKMGDIAEIRRGIRVPKSDLSEHYIARKPVYITSIIGIGHIGVPKRSKLPVVTNKDISVIDKGCVIVDSMGGFDMTVMSDDYAPCVASPPFTVVRPTGDYSNDYLYVFFCSSYFRSQADMLCTGETKNLTTSSFKEICVPAATERQQQEIVKRFHSLKEKEQNEVWGIFEQVLGI